MKTTLFLLSVSLVMVACVKSGKDIRLSQTQRMAVQQLNGSYHSASLYNDSLIYAVTGTISHADSMMIRHFDKMYHYYDEQFDSCHALYQHSYNTSDHSHNSMGEVHMHTENGMMGNCQCCSNGGHSADLHQQMSALRQSHAQYHPH